MNASTYSNRLNEFRNAQNKAQSAILGSLYAHAGNVTEEALHTLAALLKSAEAKLVEDQALIHERNKFHDSDIQNIAKQLEEIGHDLVTKTDQLSLDIATANLKMLRFTLAFDVAEINTDFMRVESEKRLQMAPALAEQLFDKIFLPDQNSFNLNAVVQGINFVISLVPVFGNVYGAVLAIRGIATGRHEGLKSADKLLVYLEEYCQALKIWTAAAQSAIYILRPVDEEAP